MNWLIFSFTEMSLPESVQLLNGQNENTMNTEVPGEALPLDSMATSLASQLSGSQDKPKSGESYFQTNCKQPKF